MILIRVTGWACAVLCFFSALSIGAHAEERLVIGRNWEGDLKKSKDKIRNERARVPFVLDDGKSLIISLESEDFDPVLRIFRIDGKSEVLVGENDDFGEGYNSRVKLSSARAGIYSLEVSKILTFSRNGRGKFRLTVSEDTPPRPLAPPETLTFGSPIAKPFIDADPDGSGGDKIARYRFTSLGNERIILFATSSSSRVSSQDDAAMKESIRIPEIELRLGQDPGKPIRVRLGRRSESTVRSSILLAERGEYFMTLRQRDAPDDARYQIDAERYTLTGANKGSLSLGRAQLGEFSLTDPETSGQYGETSGRLYQEWSLSVRQGQQIKIEMCSDTVDSIFHIIGPTIIGDHALGFADDLRSGETTSCGLSDDNALMYLSIRQNGTLRILASPIGDVGSYTIVAGPQGGDVPAPELDR